MIENFGTIEDVVNYSFVNKHLLKDAMTHRSYFHEYPNAVRTHNERIEFLGDAVLGLAITEALYREMPEAPESELSRIKSHLVSRETLAQIAVEIDIGRHIRLGKGEGITGGRAKTSVLANVMEAVIGAVFLDGGYPAARDMVVGIYSGMLRQAGSQNSFSDYKTVLQELNQKRFGKLPEYRLVDETGNDHDKTFTYEVYVDGKPCGRGAGRNKKAAQTSAARVALEKMKSPNITSNVTSNITPDISPNVSPDISSGIDPGITPNTLNISIEAHDD
jgi:ribonuclease-3